MSGVILTEALLCLFQYLDSSFSLLFQLLKEVKECDTKVGKYFCQRDHSEVKNYDE